MPRPKTPLPPLYYRPMSKIDQPQALADSYKGVYECPTVRQRRPSPKTATDNQGPARYCRPTSQVPAPAAPSRSARSATSRPAPLDAAAPWSRPEPWPWSRSSAARPATGAPRFACKAPRTANLPGWQRKAPQQRGFSRKGFSAFRELRAFCLVS